MVNVNHWLSDATKTLESSNISTARLDSLVLLEDSTSRDRSWLLAHPEFELSPTVVKTLSSQINRRINHEPLAYIRGRSEFYGREFLVSNDTLEPRSETESMIDILKELITSNDLTKDKRQETRDYNNSIIVDVGTGSGALAITAKFEFPDAAVFATDISGPALETARANANKHKVTVNFYEGNLLSPLPPSLFSSTLGYSPFALLCNLPYVPDNYEINQAATHEPGLALFGGEDGLDLYRELFTQISTLSRLPDYILTESLPFQHTKLTEIAQDSGYIQSTENEFIQVWYRAIA